MATNQNLPATDSAAVLHDLVGDDATAAFENDPKFIPSDPTANASSENLQTRADRKEIQSDPSIPLNTATVDDDEEEDEDDDEDLDEDDDDLEDDEDEEDDEDDDEDDDLEDDDDDDLDDDDEEDDDDDEDEDEE